MKAKFPRAVAVVLAVMMLISMVPVSAFATIANWEENNVVFSGTSFGTNGYYNVISKKDYVLIPGAATETEMVINNATGTRRQVMHIIELDPSNPDVSVLPGYYNIDKLAKNPADATLYKAAGVTDVANYYDTTLGYQVVGAMNTDLDYSDNAPRVLVYNGQILSGYAAAAAPQSVLYVWNKGGEISCEVTNYSKAAMEAGVAEGTLLHAISVSFGMTVKDGELVNKSVNHSGGTDDAARSMVGVKPDGTLVLVMNDGRGSNNSKGFCSYELGESMLALGCQWAANCDGGGSSSFVTRRAGEEDLVCRCVPCDGAERPTKSSVIIVSNVAPTGILDTVNITSDYDIFAPNTAYTFGATALDTHGYSMALPAEASWALADDSFGTIDNGTFRSNGKTGSVTVQVKLGGDVIGETTVQVANPEVLQFTADSTTLPYGKSTTLAFTSLIGEAEVYLDGNSFDFAIDNAGGVLDGLTFKAASDESIVKTVITATYKATGKVLTYTVNFGKGSEILYDFEDGIDGWMGYDEVVDFLYGKGYIKEKSYKALNDYYNGSGTDNFSECVVTNTFLATAENGYVHNGDKALGVVFDFTQCTFNEWCYGVLFNTTGGVLRDVANNKKAITLGMWLRMPENCEQDAGKWANQLTVWAGTDKDHLAGSQIHFQYNGVNLNNVTEGMIPENRWIYVTAALPSSNYVILADPDSSLYRSPSFLRTYIKPNIASKFVWYIDDVTLDYSSAVDDRVPPTISNPQYATADTNIPFTDGVKITDVSAAYTVTVSDDNSGIDPTTAAIYIDGNKVASTKVVGGTMFCDNVSLGVGTHKVKFEIADMLGNYTTLSRTIVSESTDRFMKYRTRIGLKGHNDSGTTPMPGSVYYIDVTSSYADGFGTAVFTLELNDANEWILDGIIPTKGYHVTYVVDNEYTNKVTFTCTSPEYNSSEKVIFSIPVRVYNPVLMATSEANPSAVSGRSFTAALKVKMTSCSVASSYGNYAEFQIDEFAGNRTVTRHDHTAYAIDDKPAELGVSGYTGRTYCDVCQSIVDFGTIIPAIVHIHSYELVNGQFVCSDPTCGDVLALGTGLYTVNGKSYYAIAGNLVTGWQEVESDFYYFGEDFAAITGDFTYEGINYHFEEDGKLTSGVWVTSAKGTRYYYYASNYYAASHHSNVNWQVIDGKTYGFDTSGYRYEGIAAIHEGATSGIRMVEFSSEGVFIQNFAANEGIFLCADGYYYILGGKPVSGVAEVNPYKTNGLIAPGTYEFDAKGKMISEPKPAIIGPELVDGYYYVNGIPTYAGLIKIGDDYYFINNKGVAVTGSQLVTAASSNGKYTGAVTLVFDEEGKALNGIHNGFYYVEGLCRGVGVVKVGDDIYYTSTTNGAVVTGIHTVKAQFTNGLIAPGTYDFGVDGKLVKDPGGDEPEPPASDVTGIVNGIYFVKGVPTSAGLIKIDGYYYYAGTNGVIAKGSKLVTAASSNGKYTGAVTLYFDEEGKAYEGIHDGFYYVEGLRRGVGAVKVGDDIYYTSTTNGAVVTGIHTVKAQFTNGLIAAGTYDFGVDGRLVG